MSLTYGDDTCSVPTYLQQEIKQYQGLANKIVDAVINGDYKGYYYNDLELFIDTYGNRLTGTVLSRKGTRTQYQKIGYFCKNNIT